MVNTCLFCRSPIESQRRGEHLIPESLGGWLKTEHVCQPCNNRFGSTVDVVANMNLMILLRQEAGLVTPRAFEGEYFDQDLGFAVAVRRNSDGIVERVRPVHQVGDSVYITAPTPELVELEAKRLRQRLERRGKTITEGPVTTEDRRVVTVGSIQNVPETTNLKALFGREAAKVAVEYVARVGSPAAALRTELDALRHHAEDGCGIDGMTVGVVGPLEIWLPRTHHLLRIRTSPLDDTPRTSLPAPRFEMTPPPGVPHLKQLQHRVGVWKDHQGARFVLELFSLLRVTIPLPPSLPIRWGQIDYRDFTQCRMGTRYV